MRVPLHGGVEDTVELGVVALPVEPGDAGALVGRKDEWASLREGGEGRPAFAGKRHEGAGAVVDGGEFDSEIDFRTDDFVGAADQCHGGFLVRVGR